MTSKKSYSVRTKSGEYNCEANQPFEEYVKLQQRIYDEIDKLNQAEHLIIDVKTPSSVTTYDISKVFSKNQEASQEAD